MNPKHIGESLHVTESNLPNSRFDRVNMSSSSFQRAKLDRAVIREVDLPGLTILRSNMSGTSIRDCKLDDMTINGLPVTDLLAAYHARAAALVVN